MRLSDEVPVPAHDAAEDDASEHTEQEQEQESDEHSPPAAKRPKRMICSDVSDISSIGSDFEGDEPGAEHSSSSSSSSSSSVEEPEPSGPSARGPSGLGSRGPAIDRDAEIKKHVIPRLRAIMQDPEHAATTPRDKVTAAVWQSCQRCRLQSTQLAKPCSHTEQNNSSFFRQR